jgi:prepilin-type N-terminal cleavage/methylation domain-containing protein
MYRRNRKLQLGFTLIEVMVVVMIIGIVSAIAVPSWIGFITNQRLGDAQTTVFQAIKQAQNLARRNKQPHMAAFRNINIGQPNESSQYVVVDVPNVPGESLQTTSKNLSQSNNLNWLSLNPDIRLVRKNEPTPETTLLEVSVNGPFLAVFDKDGNIPSGFGLDGLGRVVIRSVSLGLDTQRRCVIISTLIGSVRTARDGDCVS